MQKPCWARWGTRKGRRVRVKHASTKQCCNPRGLCLAAQNPNSATNWERDSKKWPKLVLFFSRKCYLNWAHQRIKCTAHHTLNLYWSTDYHVAEAGLGDQDMTRVPCSHRAKSSAQRETQLDKCLEHIIETIMIIITKIVLSPWHVGVFQGIYDYPT